MKTTLHFLTIALIAIALSNCGVDVGTPSQHGAAAGASGGAALGGASGGY